MNVYKGKTLESVLEDIAAKKNVDVSDITYYVLEENKGFLGFGASVEVEAFISEDVVNFIKDYLDNFFTGFDLEVSHEIDLNRNSLDVKLNSENNAILIGKNGQSLQGLNVLLRQVVNSTFKRRFFVTVDINNYKQNRYKKLRNLANHLAKKVQRSTIAVSLDPMPNDERRMIHQELSKMPKIKTVSEGSGRNRHLKIIYDENKE